MIKELTKSYLRNNKSTYIIVYPSVDIYDIEWMLIDKYNCYYWNSGDYHQDTKYHIGNIDIHEVHLDSFLKTFNYYEGFPILKLAQKILPDKFKKYILSKALQPIGTEELVKLTIITKILNGFLLT